MIKVESYNLRSESVQNYIPFIVKKAVKDNMAVSLGSANYNLSGNAVGNTFSL